jgi:hypothetical protein
MMRSPARRGSRRRETRRRPHRGRAGIGGHRHAAESSEANPARGQAGAGDVRGGIADPQIVEIIGHAGFDAFIDMEHTSFDLRDVQLMVMAAERVGITPIVRTPGFDPAFVLRLLDMGVQGIQLPHVSSAAAAREAVRAVRCAPLGDRGMAGASRASDSGNVALKDHMEQSNREITLAVMIEDLPAVAQIDARSMQAQVAEARAQLACSRCPFGSWR